MTDNNPVKLLFVINPGSGNNTTDWPSLIQNYFTGRQALIHLLQLDDSCSPHLIQDSLKAFNPDRVFAVGGDGTVKLVANCLLKTSIPLGIIPAGSANGMAKELGIPSDINEALEIAVEGVTKTIHLVKINDELCIHLADIGFNAFVIKKFETGTGRGMWGYIKAAWKVLWQQPKMQVEIRVDGKFIKRRAAMVVVANATKYGSGALINPEGKLDDEVFEVIVVKKISLAEIYKMMVTHLSYDPAKTEVYQTQSLQIKSRIKAHFQVDGEYLGKVNTINAVILPAALEVVLPRSAVPSTLS
ncbi:MAG: YegS/Rv2252/BmrU family lipid kinase [Ferruginibacter sp.]|nr:YegS/Rv2252/BmrU family lipid kinase [Ferruginibacter sp.]